MSTRPRRKVVTSSATAAALFSVVLLTTSCAAGTQPTSTRSTGLSTGASAATSPSAPPSSAAPTTPVGLVALGHSGLTAENSDPATPHAPVPGNSWATGTNPKVMSIYQRMVAEWPETRDHVFNAAQGGAQAATLDAQAQAALSIVPSPRLVVIQTVDNDLNCPMDDSTVADFGTSVEKAVQTITSQSPRSRIFFVLYAGHIADQFQADLDAAKGDPATLAEMTGPPPCGILDKNHRVQKESAAYLADKVEKLNGQLVKVCAKYATCATDKGSEYDLTLPANGLNANNDHLNVVGLAAVAKFYWPFVKSLLATG